MFLREQTSSYLQQSASSCNCQSCLPVIGYQHQQSEPNNSTSRSGSCYVNYARPPCRTTPLGFKAALVWFGVNERREHLGGRAIHKARSLCCYIVYLHSWNTSCPVKMLGQNQVCNWAKNHIGFFVLCNAALDYVNSLLQCLMSFVVSPTFPNKSDKRNKNTQKEGLWVLK